MSSSRVRSADGKIKSGDNMKWVTISGWKSRECYNEIAQTGCMIDSRHVGGKPGTVGYTVTIYYKDEGEEAINEILAKYSKDNGELIGKIIGSLRRNINIRGQGECESVPLMRF